MKNIHLIVEKGVDEGRTFTVPAQGARLGRSSKNDIVLGDPLLSRHHCRVFLNANGDLCVVDLGSSNQTLLNDKPIMEEKIKHGDIITIGDTVIRVTEKDSTANASGGVDLGLNPDSSILKQGRKIGTGPLVILALLAAAFALAAWLPKLFKKETVEQPSKPTLHAPQHLEVDYEKIEADSSNIFRYKLHIAKNDVISIEIDDVVNGRTVRKEKTVDKELIESIIRQIENSGFFNLNEEYSGIQPGILNQWLLSITTGKTTHRVKVVNRPEPENFKEIREKIEVFGKNELGLWAVQFSTEKLTEMARDEYLLGKKLFEEREIKYGNLAEALSNFRKVEIDLETVEPKPDFYADALSGQRECENILQEKYNDLNFQAERSIRLKEWKNAAEKLRIIMELIPERTDERNRQARKNILSVEEYMKHRK